MTQEEIIESLIIAYLYTKRYIKIDFEWEKE